MAREYSVGGSHQDPDRDAPSVFSLALVVLGLGSLCAAVFVPTAAVLEDVSPAAVVSGGLTVDVGTVFAGGALALVSVGLVALGLLLLFLRL